MEKETLATTGLELKQRLLAECVRMQKDVVGNLRNAMEDAQNSAIEYEDNTEDTMTDSYREEMQNKRDMFARQYEAALEDLNLLSKVLIEQQDSVQFGSVVHTEDQKLFVSISLGQIKIDNTVYFAVSPSAPIYKELSGKKVGESADFRGKKITVKEII